MSKINFIGMIGVGGCLTLSACGPIAMQNVSGDGDYRGTSTRFQASRRNCPRPGLMLNVNVRAGVMYLRWENQYIPVSVESNGRVSGAIPGVRVTGTHDGSTIQGDVTDGLCGLHFTLRRAGT